jgi:hypothetical protein
LNIPVRIKEKGVKKKHDPHANGNGSERGGVSGWLLSHTGGGYPPYRALLNQAERDDTLRGEP